MITAEPKDMRLIPQTQIIQRSRELTFTSVLWSLQALNTHTSPLLVVLFWFFVLVFFKTGFLCVALTALEFAL